MVGATVSSDPAPLDGIQNSEVSLPASADSSRQAGVLNSDCTTCRPPFTKVLHPWSLVLLKALDNWCGGIRTGHVENFPRAPFASGCDLAVLPLSGIASNGVTLEDGTALLLREASS